MGKVFSFRKMQKVRGKKESKCIMLFGIARLLIKLYKYYIYTSKRRGAIYAMRQLDDRMDAGFSPKVCKF